MKTVTPDTKVEEALTPAQQVGRDWRSIVEKVSYKAIVNNIPFIGFLSVLCMLYIHSSHMAVDLQRQVNVKTKELKELRWKAMDIQSRLLNARMETQIIRNASRLGLRPLTVPAYKINADSVTTKWN